MILGINHPSYRPARGVSSGVREQDYRRRGQASNEWICGIRGGRAGTTIPAGAIPATAALRYAMLTGLRKQR
jgi:hypothetical protein